MRSGKRQITEGKESENLEKRKLASVWEYWKWTP